MELSFGLSPWWLIPIALFAGAITWWTYRSTRDILPKGVRWALGTLRFLVLLAVGLLLLQPLISTLRKVVSPPIVVVLQDNSESLMVQRDSAFQKNSYPGKLQALMDKLTAGKVQVDAFSFGAEIKPGMSTDSLSFGESGTNIAGALRAIDRLYENQHVAAVVLASDGIPTEGSNPVYAVEGFKPPIFSVLLGDTTPQKDIRIRDISFNEIAYLKEEMPVKVEIEGYGFPSANLTVIIQNAGRTLGSSGVSISAGQNKGVANFLIKPEQAGLQAFTITVSRLPGEISYRNNAQTIYINVLETRVKIALFGGAPHPDLGALRQAFQREDRYEFTEFILKSPGNFYEDPSKYNLDDFDLFMLHNFPSSPVDKAMVDKLSELARKQNKPILFWVGAFTDLRTLSPFYDLMGAIPYTTSSKTEEVQANFLPAYQDHSTFTFGESWIAWANATPPLQRNMSDWVPKPNAEVFATSKIRNVPLDYPVYVLQSNLSRKNMVFLGEGFWRMRADAFVKRGDFEAFDAWLFNQVKWLMATEDKRKFRVDPVKRLFSGQEAALFRGQAYDDSYNPIPGAEVEMDLRGPDGKVNEYFFNESAAGQYSLEVSRLAEGAYTYEAVGRKNGAEIGRDRGQFTVGKSNVEHIRLQADRVLMEQIAVRTGGAWVTGKEVESLAEPLLALPGMKPRSEFQKTRLGVYELGWVLALLLGLLIVEWTVRKIYSLL